MKSLSAFLCFSLAVLSSSSSFAASNVPVVSARPILFVHGFNPFGIGEDCQSDWGKMKSTLSAQGFTGPMTTLSYYEDDTNCDVKISPKGSIMTPVADSSKDLAWYIYNQFSQQGVSVDVVAHSLGGLILRYALYRVSVGDSAFPPSLLIAHAATVGSPFTGYSLLAESCHLVVINIECDDMDPLSPFIADLKNPAALVPQGRGGTLWSAVGSNADVMDSSDGFVGSAAATSMEIPSTSKAIMPWYKLIFHTMYTRNAAVIQLVANSLASTEAANTRPQISGRSIAQASTRASAQPVGRADALVSHGEMFQEMTSLVDTKRPGKILPNMVNGAQSGVQFSNILPGGLFDKMGIIEGDIVSGCSADTLNDPFAAFEAIKSAGGKGSFQLCILRDGVQLTRTVAVQ